MKTTAPAELQQIAKRAGDAYLHGYDSVLTGAQNHLRPTNSELAQFYQMGVVRALDEMKK